MPSHQRRIIVIDGDPAVRDSLATLMALENLSVTAYSTAAAFLRDLDDQDIGYVVCEAELPDRQGIDLYRLLRERKPETRFALLSSRKDVQLLQRAGALGIPAVFFKPLVHRSLLDFLMREVATGD